MSDPLRVLVVIKSLGPGGAERLVVDQLRGADPGRVRYELFVCTLRAPDLLDEAMELGVPIHLGYRQRAWPLALRRVIRQGAFDVVHTHLPVAALASRLNVRTTRPRPALVYTEHNRWAAYHPLTRMLNRLSIRLDDLVIAVSSDTASSIGGSHPHVVTLTHGVNLASMRDAGDGPHREDLGLADDAFVIGTVANLRAEKNQSMLLDAFARADLGQRATLAVVGQGQLDADLRGQVERLGIGDRVRFLGYRPDAVDVMRQFDVFTLPSLHEGRPVALMEAMALGLPVVVSKVGGMVDMVDHGSTGLFVDPDDPRSLATAFERLQSEPEVRHTLAVGAKAMAAGFDAATTNAVIEGHYRELAGRDET